MSDSPDIGANLQLDLSGYSRNVQKAAREADEVDAALEAIVDSANQAEKALNELSGDVDVRLDTDFSSLLDADRTLQSLDKTVSPLVEVHTTGDTAARKLLDDLDSTVTTTVNVQDSELRDAQQLLNRLDGEAVDTKVNADSSELDDVKSKLEELRNLAVIDLVMNVAELPEQVPLLGAIADQDRARRTIAAGTGGDEALTTQYATGAEDVFASNFGADRQEAAQGYMEVVRQTADETGRLTTTGESFEQVTKDAFATATNSGEEFNRVIKAADTLVATGLAPSYESAFDMINTGFQEGLNASDDLLDTITEYSTNFANAEISAEQMFSVLKTGLDEGAFNLDFVGDLFKEFDIRAQAAASGEGIEFDAFKAMGLTDEVKAYNAGELTGAELMKGVIAAIEEGDVPPQVIFDALGTKAEDLTLPVVVKLDPTQVKEEFAQYNGTTVEVAAQLGGDIGSSFETLKRTVESELATSVSNAFDIPGKIQQFSDGVSKFSSLLDKGFTIPEAIEVAFQIPGFADTVTTLESALGNLAITVLEVAANILEGLGQGEAAGTVRGAVADYAPKQLAFDLQFADTEAEVQAAITRGVNRGIEASDIQKTLVSTGQEKIESGDLEGAREYLTLLEGIATKQADIQLTSGGIAGGFSIDTEALKTAGDVQTAAADALAPLDTELLLVEEAVKTRFENMRLSAEEKLPGMAEIATSALTPVETSVSSLGEVFAATDIAFATTNTNMTTNAAVMSGTLDGLNTDVDTFASNTEFQFSETLLTAAETGSENMDRFGENMSIMLLTTGEKVQALIDSLLSIGNLDISVPSIGVPGAGGGVIPGEAVGGVIPAGEVHRVHSGEHLVTGGAQDVSVLNRQTASVIDAAVAQYAASAGLGGGGGNVTNNISNTWIINAGGAAAGTAAIDSSRAIRGF